MNSSATLITLTEKRVLMKKSLIKLWMTSCLLDFRAQMCSVMQAFIAFNWNPKYDGFFHLLILQDWKGRNGSGSGILPLNMRCVLPSSLFGKIDIFSSVFRYCAYLTCSCVRCRSVEKVSKQYQIQAHISSMLSEVVPFPTGINMRR